MTNPAAALIADFRTRADKIDRLLAPTGCAHKVNRFTREDAERLATACNARTAFWADAAREDATTLRQHIATLEAATAA